MPTCDGIADIRRALEEDARAIAEVHVRVWRHAYRELLPAELLAGLSVDARERWWKSQIALLPEERRPWLAEEGGEIAGFVSVGPSRDAEAGLSVGEVYAIYVTPECWDRGVGRTLLEHGVRDLFEHGYSEATLWVLARNVRARRFYEAAGWDADRTERVERFGGQDVTEVRYRRRLP